MTKLDDYKKKYLYKFKEELRLTNTDISCCKRRIDNITKAYESGFGEKYRNDIANKARDNIDKYEIKKKNIENKISDLNYGKLDEWILNKIKEDEDIKEKELEEIERKKQIEKKQIEKKQQISKKVFQAEKSYDRENRNDKYKYNREYFYYNKNSKKLPSYIAKNLKEMTNNKGYIWRDIAFFGEKQTDEMYPIILFEKFPDKTLRIHETTEDTYKIFEKKGKKKQKLIKEIVRNNPFKRNKFNLLDFVSKK